MSRRCAVRWSVGPPLASLLFILAVGCAPSKAQRPQDTAPVAPPVAVGAHALTIVATNDLHGQLTTETYSFTHGKPTGGAAVLKAYIDSFRQQGEVLLVDVGDFMQGAPESALFGGKSVVQYMNYAGYRAAAVGNHEFDWGIDTLAQRASEAQFPLLCANLLDAGTGQPFPFTKPSLVVDVGGTKVGLIGVLTEGTPGMVTKSIRERIRVTNAAQAASAQADAVRAQGAKVVVLLAHLGGTQSGKSDTPGGDVHGEAGELARQLGGKVDLILSGHTHTRINQRVNGILITQAYSKGTAIAKIDVGLDTTGAVASTQAEIISTYADKVTQDAGTQELLKPYFDEVTRRLSAALGEAAENISEKGGGQTPMGYLVADAIREAADAQMGFTNAGGIRNGIAAWKTTMRDVFDIMPFDNLVLRGEATGETVLRILRHGVKGRSSLQVAGISVSGTGKALRARLASGEEISAGKRYTIAANDFIWEGAEGFTMLPPADAAYPRTLVRYALAEYIKKHSPVRVER